MSARLIHDLGPRFAPSSEALDDRGRHVRATRGADGVPLVLPINATVDDLRRAVGPCAGGDVYRVDWCDEDEENAIDV